MSFTGLTALQMAADAKLKRGDRVLVNGASGGVGTMAVQLARDVVGPEGVVVGICSGKNAEMVRGLGADEVIYSPARRERLDHILTILCNRSSIIPHTKMYQSSSRRDTRRSHSTQYSTASEHPKSIMLVLHMSRRKGYIAQGVKLPSWSMCGLAQAPSKIILNALWPTSTRL
jgi:D-arabinose 1-dehydrogenase-like Zn-dependent alcohol dehydrogenase